MRRFIAILILLAVPACGGSQNPPSGGNTDGAQTIRGTERIGWDQQAVTPAELASFRFAMYVDGTRRELPDAVCTPPAGSVGYPCSARLPALAPGAHTLELSTYVSSGGTISESPRSAPLRVFVSSSSSSASVQAPSSSASATPRPRGSSPDGTTVTDGLDDPTDLAFAPDGRLFIAERRGIVRTVQNGTLEPQTALTLPDVFVRGDSGGLLGIALHPDFERTRTIYTLLTAEGRSGEPVFQLARFREAGGTFGERAVLMDGIPASPGRSAGAIRFGPDRALYVAFDDGGDPASVGDAASYNGKVLRLNADGTTPADQPAGSPVHDSGYAAPCALDWRPDTGTLWVADCRVQSLPRLVGVTSRKAIGRAAIRAEEPLVERTQLRGAVFYRGELIPAWHDQLLLAADQGLLRVRFDPMNPSKIARVDAIDPGIGPLQAVASGPDGALYVCTRTTLVKVTAMPSQ